MNPPTPDFPPDAGARVADALDWSARLAASLAALWVLVVKVWKPYTDWKHRRHTQLVRAMLKDELTCIDELKRREDEVDGKYTEVSKKLDRVLERQSVIFDEIDLFVTVVSDSYERQNEVYELLDAVGLSSRDRRQGGERREQAEVAMRELQGHLRKRRRLDDDVTPEPEAESHGPDRA